MDRHRVEHPLYRRVARLAGDHRIVGHPLHDLKGVTLLAPVLVNRHRFRKYSLGCLGTLDGRVPRARRLVRRGSRG